MDTEMEHGNILGDKMNGKHHQLVQIGPHALQGAWEDLMPSFRIGEKALRPLGGVENVFRNVISGKWQLFVILENGESVLAAMVTEISERADGRTLVMLWLGGSHMDLIVHFFPKLEKWAKIAECVYIEAWVRKGLTRVLPDVGMKTELYIMRKGI